MKRYTKLLSLLLALAMLLALSACGENGGTTGPSGVAMTTTDENGSTRAPDSEEITAGQPATDKQGNTVTQKPQGGETAVPGTTQAPLRTARVSDTKQIYFDEAVPDYLSPQSSWDAIGVTPDGTVYFGWTCNRLDDGLEDFAVLSYAPSTGKVTFIDTFMNVSKAAGNLQDGEAIPKGHTKFVYNSGKLYMASQGFHDFKEEISDLGNYRGAHIYALDVKSGKLEDLTAKVKDGIAVKNEGIVALNIIPERNLIVGLTHPHSNLVFFNYKTNKVERTVNGIPWSLGNPLSREVIVSGDKVYLYRGVEEPNDRAKSFPVYVYDYKTNKLSKTGDNCFGGFWNGQYTTSDGKYTYISTSCGELYRLDRKSGRLTHLTSMSPEGYESMGYVYSLNASADESKLYYIPTMYQPSGVYEYDIAHNTVSQIGSLPRGCFTGNGVKDKFGYYYYACFSTSSGMWSGDCRMVAVKIETP